MEIITAGYRRKCTRDVCKSYARK